MPSFVRQTYSQPGGRAFRATARRGRHRPRRVPSDSGSRAARRSQNRRSGAGAFPPPRARKATARCRAGHRRWAQSGCSSSRLILFVRRSPPLSGSSVVSRRFSSIRALSSLLSMAKYKEVRGIFQARSASIDKNRAQVYCYIAKKAGNSSFFSFHSKIG